jgi:hypothetical protein
MAENSNPIMPLVENTVVGGKGANRSKRVGFKFGSEKQRRADATYALEIIDQILLGQAYLLTDSLTNFSNALRLVATGTEGQLVESFPRRAAGRGETVRPEFALSIKQPWAWLIAKGYKDIENRNWFIGRKVASGAVNFTVKLPIRIYIHAGKTFDLDSLQELIDGDFGNLTDEQREYLNRNELTLETMCGAIIGEVDITACVTESNSPWFEGKYGFTLKNPVLYPVPIPCRGQLGFFKPNIAEVKCQ